MKDVKLIRMITGEEIIAEVLDWKDGVLTIKNALLVILSRIKLGLLPGQR